MNHIIFFILVLSLIPLKKGENVLNAGIGGNNTVDLLARIDKDVLEKSPDIAIIMIGTNDMLNSKKWVSLKEYKQNLDSIVGILKENKIQVVLCSPPPVDTAYLFERHNRNLFSEEPNIKLDSITHFMKRFSIKEDVCFVDINSKFKSMNIPTHNLDNYIQNEMNSKVSDGVHPTSAGYSLIAETIFSVLQEHKLISRKGKIICFGDSITFGTGVKEEGTANGNTYPAVLQNLITQTFANK
ncbi:MAG: hypothetical protein JXR65_10045 [Bacteroidales bacterium]|nr:hypothetical protein [Bacteroidales bacterium]